MEKLTIKLSQKKTLKRFFSNRHISCHESIFKSEEFLSSYITDRLLSANVETQKDKNESNISMTITREADITDVSYVRYDGMTLISVSVPH